MPRAASRGTNLPLTVSPPALLPINSSATTFSVNIITMTWDAPEAALPHPA